MTEYSRESAASNFVLSLNIPPQKLFWWFRRLQLWATGAWQLHYNNTPTHASHLVQSFWWNMKSPRWRSPPTAQIWGPVTSGFPQNYNHLWMGRDFRPSMIFRKMQWGSWWLLGEQCKVPRCLLWRGLRHHFPMCSVSSILYLLQQMSPFSIVQGWILSGQTCTTIVGLLVNAHWVHDKYAML